MEIILLLIGLGAGFAIGWTERTFHYKREVHKSSNTGGSSSLTDGEEPNDNDAKIQP